ncbi:MAG: hypothetical protein R3C28_11635 [Pirellulaceae bacterium]
MILIDNFSPRPNEKGMKEAAVFAAKVSSVRTGNSTGGNQQAGTQQAGTQCGEPNRETGEPNRDTRMLARMFWLNKKTAVELPVDRKI